MKPWWEQHLVLFQHRIRSTVSQFFYNRSVDHFKHDAEAYASGANLRTSHVAPRSRSPTPFGDEDYMLDAHNTAHYSGYHRHTLC